MLSGSRGGSWPASTDSHPDAVAGLLLSRRPTPFSPSRLRHPAKDLIHLPGDKEENESSNIQEEHEKAFKAYIGDSVLLPAEQSEQQNRRQQYGQGENENLPVGYGVIDRPLAIADVGGGDKEDIEAVAADNITHREGKSTLTNRRHRGNEFGQGGRQGREKTADDGLR